MGGLSSKDIRGLKGTLKEKWKKPCHALKRSHGSLNRTVPLSCFLHLLADRKDHNRTQQRSAPLKTSPRCCRGVRFSCPELSHIRWQEGQLLAACSTTATKNDPDTAPKPSLSHLIQFLLKGPVSVKLSTTFSICRSTSV